MIRLILNSIGLFFKCIGLVIQVFVYLITILTSFVATLGCFGFALIVTALFFGL